MNERIESILEQPPKIKALIVVASLGVVLGIFYYMFFSSTLEEYTKLQEELDDLQFQIAEKREVARNLDRFTAEVDSLEIELKKALSELPDKKEVAELLARVSGVGQDAGLEIRLFKPLEEKKRDYYAEVPVELEVSGTYHQVGTFFDEVGHLSRIVNLDEFHMTEPQVEDEAVTLKARVVATTFRFLDESERVVEEKEPGKRRKRRRKK